MKLKSTVILPNILKHRQADWDSSPRTFSLLAMATKFEADLFHEGPSIIQSEIFTPFIGFALEPVHYLLCVIAYVRTKECFGRQSLCLIPSEALPSRGKAIGQNCP